MTPMSCSTLKMCEHMGIVARSTDEAIHLLCQQYCRTIILVSSNRKALGQMVDAVYAKIKEENAEISDVNQQTLPTEPYYWTDIDGCLSVRCCEIDVGTYAENKGHIAIFRGWNYDVLHADSIKTAPDARAFVTMAALGNALLNEGEKHYAAERH